MITIEQIVQREVLCCMSSLVSTLAQGYADPKLGIGTQHIIAQMEALRSLCDQASELAAPVLDYEEAARSYGAVQDSKSGCWADNQGDAWATAEELCGEWGHDPYEWEVYEHWAVSTWLADKLQVQGEKVDNDFAGMAVWARTTTGQSISMDGCIRRVYEEMIGPCKSHSPEVSSQ